MAQAAAIDSVTIPAARMNDTPTITRGTRKAEITTALAAYGRTTLLPSTKDERFNLLRDIMIAAGDHPVGGAAPAAGGGAPGGGAPEAAVAAPVVPLAAVISTSPPGPDGLRRVQVLPGPLADTIGNLGLWIDLPLPGTPGITFQGTAALVLAGTVTWSAAGRRAPYGSTLHVGGLNKVNTALFAHSLAFISSGAAAEGLRDESQRLHVVVDFEDLDAPVAGRFAGSPLAALHVDSFESPRSYLACLRSFPSAADDAEAAALLDAVGGPRGTLKQRGAGFLCEELMNPILRSYPMTPPTILAEQQAISFVVDGSEDMVVQRKLTSLLQGASFPRLGATILGAGRDTFAVGVRLEQLLGAARLGPRTSLAALHGLEAALERCRATGPAGGDTEAAAQARTRAVAERLGLVGAAASGDYASAGASSLGVGGGGGSSSSTAGAASGGPSRNAIAAAVGEHHALLDLLLPMTDSLLAIKFALDSGSLVLRRALLYGASMAHFHAGLGAIQAHALQSNVFLAAQLLKDTSLPPGSARALAAGIDGKEAAKMLAGGAPSVAAVVQLGQLHDHFIACGCLLPGGGAAVDLASVCMGLETLVPFMSFLHKWVASLRLPSKDLEEFPLQLHRIALLTQPDERDAFFRTTARCLLLGSIETFSSQLELHVRSDGSTKVPTFCISAEDKGVAKEVVAARRQLNVAGAHWGLQPLSAASVPTRALEALPPPAKRAKAAGNDGAGKGVGNGAGKGAGKGGGRGGGSTAGPAAAGSSTFQGGRVQGIIKSNAFHVSETEGVVNWSGQRFDLRKVRRVWASKNPGVPLHLTGVLTTAPWPNAPRFIPTSVTGGDLAVYKQWIEADGARECKLDFGEAPEN
jgi:hypothetical protein